MDPELVGQMNDLASYIQGNEGYQLVPLDPSVAETGNRELSEALAPVSDEQTRRLTPDALDGTTVGEPSSGAAGNVDISAVPGQQNAGVTSQPSAGFDPEKYQLRQQLDEVQRREQAAIQNVNRLAQEAARREELLFQQQLAAEPDPIVRAQKYVQYKEQQANARVGAVQAQLDSIAAQSNEAREELAKSQIAVITAQQYRLAPDDLRYLKMARSPQEMEDVARDLARRRGATQQTNAQQTRQQRIESGVDVAGGESAGYTPPKAPQERSGDLIGLIRSRQHQLVNTLIEPTR